MDDGRSREEYIRRVLEAYRKTPGTMGTVRRPDRVLVAQLYQRGVSVSVIENAFVLAATRRLIRPADSAPLGTIRSLAYFLPVIEEVLDYTSTRITSNTSARSSNASRQPGRSGPFGTDAGKPTRTPAAWMISPIPSTPAKPRLRRG